MIEANQLTDAMALCKQAIKLKSGLQILEHILFHSDGQGTATISSTNLDVRIDANFPYNGPAISQCIPHKILEVVTQNPEIATPIKLTMEGRNLNIQAGPLFLKTVTLPADEFPTKPKLAGTPKQIQETDLDSICQALVYASTDPSRYILNGVHLTKSTNFGGQTNWIVGTDGRRLLTAYPKGEIPFEGTLTSKFVEVIANNRHQFKNAKALKVNDLAQMELETNFGTVTITGKLIDGIYPNWAQVVPSTEPTETIRWNCDGALTELKLIQSLDSTVTLQTEKTGTTFKTKEARIWGEHPSNEGGSITIGFQNIYLQDLCRTFPDQTIELEIRPEGKPMTVRQGIYHIVMMPIRQTI